MKITLPLQVLVGGLLAVLIVFVGLKSWNAVAEHSRIGVAVRDRDTITVNGEGKVKSTPDVVRVSLGVQTDASTVRAAQTENTRKMNAITAMLKQQGIADVDLTTENYSIYPKVDWQSGTQRILGYTVSQNVSAKIRDLDKTGEILSLAGELGANQVGGVQFTIDDPTALQSEARDKAIADAKDKAEALARQLGVTLVKVVGFSESIGGGFPQPYFAKDLAMTNESIGGAAPEIQTGTQEVLSNVNLVFEVY